MLKAARISILIITMLIALPVSTGHAQENCSWVTNETLYLAANYNPVLDVSYHPVIYTPPHTRGDRDFKGHGPDIAANGTVYLVEKGMYVDASMRATETRKDWTTAFGVKRQIWFLHLRPGFQIRNAGNFEWVVVNGGMAQQRVIPESIISVGTYMSVGDYRYVDTNHKKEIFYPNNTNFNLIERVEIVGDTDGNEAGTKTNITFFPQVDTFEICS